MRPDLRPRAVIRNYAQLIAVVRARIDELNVAAETIDDVAGLPTRYTAKLLCPMQMKALGRHSLGPMLGTVGLALVAVDDDEALARVQSRLSKRRGGRRRPVCG